MSAARIVPALLVASLASTACDDDPVVASGNLVRPSALAYLPRTSLMSASGTTAVELRRSDLLVADSEAQGVRLIQYEEQIDSRDLEDFRRFRPAFFVPAPVTFFSLAADAPGFPTEMSIVPQNGDQPPLVVALAPSRAQLHVLEVAETPYQAPATTNTNRRLVTVDLFASGLDGLPVDVAFVERSPGGIRVLVLLDGRGTAPAQLALLSVDTAARPSETAPEPAMVLGIADVGLGASDLYYREVERTALVASAATATVTQVALAQGDALLGATSTISALGPVSRFVNLGTSGVLGLRLDRSAAVWLRPGPGGFERPDVVLPSGFDGLTAEELVQEPGVLTLRSPLAVTGAHAELDRLTAPSINTFVFFDSVPEDVAMVVHTDGFATYVRGGPVGSADPTPPTIAVSGLPRFDRIYSAPLPQEDIAALEVPACDLPPVCSQQALNASACGSLALSGRPFAGALGLRVSPEGTLISGRNSYFTVRSNDGTTLVADVIDGRLANFVGHRVRVGDSVRLDLKVDQCGSTTSSVGAEFVLEGTVTEVGTGIDPRGTAELVAARARVALNVVRSDIPNPLSACRRQLSVPFLEDNDPANDERADEDPALRAGVFYEVHVPDGAREAVLAEVAGEQVLRVIERNPIDVDVDVRNGWVQAVMRFGYDDRSPIRLNVAGSTVALDGTDPLASLRCRRVSAEDSPSLGFCETAADCGVGRQCIGAVGAACAGVCATECLDETLDCFDVEFDRVCPRVDVLAVGPQVLVDLRGAGLSADASRIEGSGTVPADAVYHPQRGSFFVSFPGSRTLVEVPARVTGAALVRIR